MSPGVTCVTCWLLLWIPTEAARWGCLKSSRMGFFGEGGQGKLLWVYFLAHPTSCLCRYRTNSHAAIDWGKMAEQWLQEKEAERRKQKQRLTPRPSPSPMIESTPMSIAGDATPLLDEMDR